MRNLIIIKKKNQIESFNKKVGGAIPFIRNFKTVQNTKVPVENKTNMVSNAKINSPKPDDDSIKLGRDTVMHDGAGVSQINENLKKLNFANMKKNNIKFIV
jgi:hypothetical protein